jgi:hypothetical protein
MTTKEQLQEVERQLDSLVTTSTRKFLLQREREQLERQLEKEKSDSEVGKIRPGTKRPLTAPYGLREVPLEDLSLSELNSLQKELNYLKRCTSKVIRKRVKAQKPESSEV